MLVLPVVVNKVLLAHSNAHLCTYYLWLLPCDNSSVELLRWSLHGSRSLNYLPSGPLQKMFTDPWTRP